MRNDRPSAAEFDERESVMATVVWTIFAVGIMIGMFAGLRDRGRRNVGILTLWRRRSNRTARERCAAHE